MLRFLILCVALFSIDPYNYSHALEESFEKSNKCTKYNNNAEGREVVGIQEEEDEDPALTPKVYSIGGKNISVPTYITPNVATFYKQPEGSLQVKEPIFPGFAVKFINLSPFTVALHWYPGHGRNGILFNHMPAWGVQGTASFPSHQFYLTRPGSVRGSNSDEKIHWFTMKKGQGLYVYDAFALGHEQVENLDEKQYSHRVTLMDSLEFSEQYREITGRDWHSLYPLRKKPVHKMWRADYFGQEHWIETKETHFVDLPPASDLEPVREEGIQRRLDESEPRVLNEYRQPNQETLNLTLKVLSCAPRAFEINNFLSDVEVDHILYLSTGISLHKSHTGTSGGSSYDNEVKTRTSRNSWVPREKSPIVDAIYRRAADVLRIDEAILRRRDAEEMSDYPVLHRSAAENLQLVHYTVGQEYTAHHDFAYPAITDEHQRTRFATLLLYLNEGMEGGATSFPRYMNADTSSGLKVEPKRGKAVLFYSYLPDGNLDDLSQHAAEPVTKGEKWLTNLWVWDPVF